MLMSIKHWIYLYFLEMYIIIDFFHFYFLAKDILLDNTLQVHDTFKIFLKHYFGEKCVPVFFLFRPSFLLHLKKPETIFSL